MRSEVVEQRWEMLMRSGVVGEQRVWAMRRARLMHCCCGAVCLMLVSGYCLRACEPAAAVAAAVCCLWLWLWRSCCLRAHNPAVAAGGERRTGLGKGGARCSLPQHLERSVPAAADGAAAAAGRTAGAKQNGIKG